MTLTVLGCATRAIAAACGSVGCSTGGAGSGSRPTNRSGSPESSRRSATPPATTSGGGAMPLSARITPDVWARLASRGNGEIARKLPTSQMTRNAWRTPTPAPRTSSRAPKIPFPRPSPSRRPTLAPSASPMPTRTRIPPRTASARGSGSSVDSGSAKNGSRVSPRIAPIRAPVRPPSCGSAPERNPATAARMTMSSATMSSGFTATMVAWNDDRPPAGASDRQVRASEVGARRSAIAVRARRS